jgi:hypothetical protein
MVFHILEVDSLGCHSKEGGVMCLALTYRGYQNLIVHEYLSSSMITTRKQ